MAKIIKTNSQEQALKEIVDSLKIITSLNKLLKDENVSECRIKVMGVSQIGNLIEQIPISYGMVIPVLKDYRKKLTKEVIDKSKTYAIQLDENEETILGIRKEPVTKEQDEQRDHYS